MQMQNHQPMRVPSTTLVVIKVMHTFVWAIFVACIVAIPIMSWLGRHSAAAWFAAIVAAECIVLVVNKMRCPLTSVAARYTEDRSANFDIYLPQWLARHNKLIFGALYLAGIVYFVVRWPGYY
jgi:hypothetical protein